MKFNYSIFLKFSIIFSADILSKYLVTQSHSPYSEQLGFEQLKQHEFLMPNSPALRHFLQFIV